MRTVSINMKIEVDAYRVRLHVEGWEPLVNLPSKMVDTHREKVIEMISLALLSHLEQENIIEGLKKGL